MPDDNALRWPRRLSEATLLLQAALSEVTARRIERVTRLALIDDVGRRCTRALDMVTQREREPLQRDQLND